MADGPKNVAASVRQKLLNISAGAREDFGLVLTRYALERLLYRLSKSPYRDYFVLKGAMLFQVWTQTTHRPTRDLDLLGHGDPSPNRCAAVFRELCEVVVEADGLVFSAATVHAGKIKEEQTYEGVRVKFLAHLENARIPIQVDIGFGDAVSPSLLDYPTLLAMPAPRVQAYPMESVVAEKLEAMISLGMPNSRMKDFFDVWFLARTFPFAPGTLAGAFRATFERRGTQLDPHSLDILLTELSGDPSKQTQWRAFSRKTGILMPDEFPLIVRAIREFLSFPVRAAITGADEILSWPPSGPWQADAGNSEVRELSGD
jgi:predicted nucleotidyltransferase component of viral defense system